MPLTKRNKRVEDDVTVASSPKRTRRVEVSEGASDRITSGDASSSSGGARSRKKTKKRRKSVTDGDSEPDKSISKKGKKKKTARKGKKKGKKEGKKIKKKRKEKEKTRLDVEESTAEDDSPRSKKRKRTRSDVSPLDKGDSGSREDNGSTTSSWDSPTETYSFGDVSILLFYQYVEPNWSNDRYKQVLEKVQLAGEQAGVCGRVRVAREGLNGTLSSASASGVRAFAHALRQWDAVFMQTDFKFIDGRFAGQHFKEFKVIPVVELVNYGLGSGNDAPPLSMGGTHLPANEYHKKMSEPDTVMIDVRNTYESIIGRFNPPNAEWLDPKMRKSTEFAQWLTSEETKKRLEGKQVLMYCTGGIRCERASALLRCTMDDKLKGVYQLKGGIERYMQSFPDGGHWKGKNFVFDKRFAAAPKEQELRQRSTGAVGGAKESAVVDVPEEAVCASCGDVCDRYRGKQRCSICKCPVLLCNGCLSSKSFKGKMLRCTLCVEENRTSRQLTRKEKRARWRAQNMGQSHGDYHPVANPTNTNRCHVANLPYSVTQEELFDALSPANAQSVHWLHDKETGDFYGAGFVTFASAQDAALAAGMTGKRCVTRAMRINFAK